MSYNLLAYKEHLTPDVLSEVCRFHQTGVHLGEKTTKAVEEFTKGVGLLNESIADMRRVVGSTIEEPA